MLIRSQPLDPKAYKKIGLDDINEREDTSESNIESQRIGKMFESKYPKYQYLITEYEGGGTGYSGDFVAQSSGWVGKESGKNPREGYFVFAAERFELADSPDKIETDRLLSELSRYHEEIEAAYRQAEVDSDNDFERLGFLLKENLYSWWD